MSKQIENNVVQMTFDNKDFEKNISTSSKSIEKLNEQLKFKDASDGFKNLEKMANAISFGGFEKAINHINSVFTVTGNLSHKIIDEIAGYFESKIVGTVNAVRSKITYILDPNLGISKYEQYNTALNTMAGNLSDMDRKWLEDDRKRLGEDIQEFEYAENYIQKIAAYADETSYSLTDMVDTMSKFAAANVNLRDSTMAMQGFANMAAVAGQNSKVASSAMYQLAQSFNTGFVKYQDWQQAFGLKNIATKEAKEIFVQAALKAGTLDEKDIATAKKELGAENYINYFFTSDALNKGEWLETGTVLVEGLKEYSKVSDHILGNLDSYGNATVSELLGWIKGYRELRDKNQEAKDAYLKNLDFGTTDPKVIQAITDSVVELSKAEYDLSFKAFLAAQQATNFHEALDATRDAVGTKMMYAFKWLFGDLEQSKALWTGLAETLWNVFAGPLDATLGGLETWNRSIYEINLKTGETITYYEKFWESVSRVFGGIGSIFTGLFDQIKVVNGLVDDTGEALELTDIIRNNTLRFMEKITKNVKKLADNIDRFLNSAFYQNLQMIFRNITISVKNIKNIIGRLVGATVGTAIKNLGKPLTTLSDIVVKLTEKFAFFTGKILGSQTFNDITDRVAKIVEKLMGLGNAILKVFGDFMLSKIEAIGRMLNKIFEFLKPGIDWMLRKIDENLLPALDELTEGPYSVGAAFEWLMEKLAKAKDSIKDFVKETLNINFEDAKEKISGFGQHVKDTFSSKGSNIVEILRSYIETNFSKDSKGSLPNLLARIAEAETAMDGVKEGIKWTGDAITKPISLVLDIVGELIGVDLSKLSEGFSKFVHAITDGLAEISPNVLNAIKTVGTIFLDILGFVFQVIKSIFDFLSGAKDTTGYQALDGILAGIKMLIEALVDVFAHALSALGTVAKLIGPGLNKAIDLMVMVIKAVADMIKQMFEDLAKAKDPDKLVDYLWDLAKVIIGLLILVKVIALIQGVTGLIKSAGGVAQTLTDAIGGFASSVKNLTKSLAGDTVGGMLRIMAVLMFSIGYALSKVVRAGEALADPKIRNGMIAAFLAMILLMRMMFNMAKQLIKEQQKLDNPGIAGWFRTKIGVGVQKSSTTHGFNSTVQFLVGMAAVLVGVGMALSMVANAAKNVGVENIAVAAGAISIMMLVTGLVLKMVKMENKTKTVNTLLQKSSLDKSKTSVRVASKLSPSKSMNVKKDGSYQTTTKEGSEGSYSGIIGAMFAMANFVLLVTPPLILMGLASKILGRGAIGAATTTMVIVLGVAGLVLRMCSKYSNNMNFSGLAGLATMLIAVTNLMVLVGVTIGGLAIVLGQLVPPSAYGVVTTVSIIMLLFFTIIGTFITIWTEDEHKDIELKQAIKDIAKKLAKVLVASSIFVTMAIAIASIGGVIGMLVWAIEKLKKANPNGGSFLGLPSEIWSVLLIIGLVLGAIIAGATIISSQLKGTGKGKAALAKGGVIAVLMLEFVGIVLAVSGALTIMALTFKVFKKGEMWKALGLMVGVTALIAGVLVALTYLSNVMSGKKGGKGKTQSGAKNMLAMATAMLLMSAAIMAISFAIVGLAKGLKEVSAGDLTKAIIVFVVAVGALVGVMFAIKYAGVAASAGIKAIAGALLMLVAVVGIGIGVIALVKHYGDDILDWAEENSDKVRKVLQVVTEAFLDALIGIAQGILDRGPQLLASLTQIIFMITGWLIQNVGPIASDILEILKNIIVAIGEKFSDPDFTAALGTAIGHFFSGLLGAVIVALTTFVEDIINWFSNDSDADLYPAGETMMDGFIAAVKDTFPIISDIIGWIVDKFEKAYEGISTFIERIAEKSEEEMHDEYRGRLLEGYKRSDEQVTSDVNKYMRLVQAYKKATGQIEKMEAYNELMEFTAQLQSRYRSVASYKNMAEGEAKNAITTLYNRAASSGREIDKGFLKGLMEGESWWDLGQKYMGQFIDGANNKAKIKSPSRVFMQIGAFCTEGFIKGLDDNYEEGQQWMEAFLDGAKDEGDIHSPSGETKSIGSFLKEGLLNGLGNSKDIGKNFMSNLLSGVTESIKNSSAVSDIKNSLTGVTSGFSDMTSSFQMQGFSTELSPVYSLDSVSQPTYETDYDYALDTTAAVDSIDTLDDTVYDSNSDLVNEVKGLREEMAKYAEAIEQIQMVLDTGALVGELVAPMDKALGERNDRKAARGI